MHRTNPGWLRTSAAAVVKWIEWPFLRVELVLLSLYRTFVSPALPARCRFYPSCSAYGFQSVRAHGPLKGPILAVGRVARCHPWHPGGINPVPPPGRWRADVDLDGNQRAGVPAGATDDLAGA